MLEDASIARGSQNDLFARAQEKEIELPEDALREALQKINPDELSPREALELLYRLKKLQ
jgi:DNA mismatch repair protein MutS